MATNLLLGYPQIFFDSTVWAGPTGATGYDDENVMTGSRALRYKRSAAGTSSEWDLHLDAGVTVNPDYLYIARANLLRLNDSASTTWTLLADDNTGFASPETETDTFDTSDLVGPDSDDLLATLSFTTAYRYFRFTIETTVSFQHETSKILIGDWFDFGRDPSVSAEVTRDAPRSWSRRSAYDFRLTWDGITDAKLATFIDRLSAYSDVHPFLLYDSANVIVPKTVALVDLVDLDVDSTFVNQNTITARFTEQL